MTKKRLFFIFYFLFFNVALAKDYYGAIYVDETTGIAGVAIDYSNGESAKQAALKVCKGKSGKKNCEYIAGWYNSCVAAAWSPLKKSARRGEFSDNQRQAEKNALQRCRSVEKDNSCKLVATACTSWETEEVIWW